MIIMLILNIFKAIATLLINTIGGTLGNQATLNSTLTTILNTILSITGQAKNFCYFLMGDTMYIVLPIAITILIAKYTVIPLIIMFRSFFINSNN